MKKSEKQKLRGLKVSELGKQARELRDQVAWERLKLTSGELKNLRAVKILRQKLTVVLSILQEKALRREEA